MPNKKKKKKERKFRLMLPKLTMFFLILLQFLFFLALFILVANLSAMVNLSFVFILLIFLLDVACIFYIFVSDSASPFKLTWILLVVALPIAGLTMYLAFANKQTKAKAKKSKKKWGEVQEKVYTSPEIISALEDSCPEAVGIAKLIQAPYGEPMHRHSSSTYFSRVEDAWPAILDEIRKAKYYIYVEFFIIHPGGEFYDSVLEELEKKVAEGVEVRFIYDDFGALRHAPFLYWRELKARGIKGECFYPLRPVIDIRMNNRDHRKILLIDGHTCFTGGFNLSDEYVNIDSPFGYWKDNVIMIRGEAVENFARMFLVNWVSSFHPDEEGYGPAQSSAAHIEEIGGYPLDGGFIQPYGDIPFDKESTGEKLYVALCHAAKSTLDIVTPYLILDEVMENALIDCVERGVRLRILTPKIPDKRAVFNLTRSYYGKLLEHGAEIYEFTPGFVHEKMAICDGKMASVGSINLDYRALYLDLQNAVFLVNDPSIADMARDFEESVQVSTRIDLPTYARWKKRNRFYWGMLRIIAPML